MNCLGSYPECPCKCCYTQNDNVLTWVGALPQNTICCSSCETSANPTSITTTLPWIGDNKIEEKRYYSYKPPPRFFLIYNGLEYEYKDEASSLANVIIVSADAPLVNLVVTNGTDKTKYSTSSFSITTTQFYWRIQQYLDYCDVEADFYSKPTEIRVFTIVSTSLVPPLPNVVRYISFSVVTSWRPEIHPVYTQYTPNYRGSTVGGAQGLIEATAISQSQTDKVSSQDPDGFIHVSRDQWVLSRWDGIPWTKSQFCAANQNDILNYLFPSSPYCLRGLRELFYTKNPFTDWLNPTPAEIDNWNLIVLNHFKHLLGKTEDHVFYDEMFYQSLWANERLFSDVWNTLYPVGICSPDPSSICGYNFHPNRFNGEQTPYLMNGKTPFQFRSHAESRGLIPDFVPWCSKMSAMIHYSILHNFTGTQYSSLIFRNTVGFGFHNYNGSTYFRFEYFGSITYTCP